MVGTIPLLHGKAFKPGKTEKAFSLFKIRKYESNCKTSTYSTVDPCEIPPSKGKGGKTPQVLGENSNP